MVEDIRKGKTLLCGIELNKDGEALKSKIFTLLLVLLMFGNTYVFPYFRSITFGEIVILIAFIILFFKRNTIFISLPKKMGCFFAYSFIVTIIVAVLSNSLIAASTRLLRDAVYWCLVLVGTYNFVDFKLFKKYVKMFCVALSSFIVLQVVTYALTGYLIPGLFSNGYVDATTNGQYVYNHILFWVGHAGYLKPNGFLSEAAHSAQCLFIGALIVIFDKKTLDGRYFDFLLVLLFMGASVLTFSASAVVFCVFLIAILIYKIFQENNVKGFFTLIIMFLFGSAVLISMGLGAIVNRVLNALAGGANDGSAYTRLFKGFAFYKELSFGYKIFGIGFGNYETIAANMPLFSEEGSFMNTLSLILVSSGIIGFMIFAYILVRLYKLSNNVGKIFLLALIIMSFSASIYSSAYWVWLMTAILYNKKNNKGEKVYGSKIVEYCSSNKE